MASEIKITFSATPSVNDSVSLSPSINLRFVNDRSGYGEVSRTGGGDAPYSTLFIAISFFNSFKTDFNAGGSGPFTMQRTSNPDSVTIQHPTDGFFSGATKIGASITLAVSTIAKPKPIPFNVYFVTPDDDICNKVKVRVTTDQIVDQMYIFGGPTASTSIGGPENDANIIERDLVRGLRVEVWVTHDGLTNKRSYYLPQAFNIREVIIADQKIQIVPSANRELIFQYAVVEGQFSTSSIFTGIVPGVHTAYIKDQFGCIKSKQFTVKEFSDDTVNFAKQYSDVPLINDFRFVNRSRGNNVNANQFEFLSSEMPDSTMVNGFGHPVGEDEIHTIQFRSTAEENTVQLITCEGNSYDIIPQKKGDFMNRTRTLSGAVTYNTTIGRNLVSFSFGDEYDKNDQVIGTHQYNGTLPFSYEKGTILFIERFGQTVITEITTIGGIQYAVLNISVNQANPELKIKDVIKLYNYNVFEFEINTIDYFTDAFYLSIKMGPDTWISEMIKVVPNIEKSRYHKVIYGSNKNYENNDVHYQFGIKHLRWVPYQNYLDPMPTAEIEILASDDRIDKKDYRAKRIYRMVTEPMPKMIADGLAESLNVSTIINVDGKEYVNEEGAEIEIKGNWAILSVNLTLARKTLTYGQDEGVFNIDEVYPVILT